MTKDYDVIVVGAGNAAICAALTAKGAGAKVLVLEKAPREMRGGNTCYTAASYKFARKGMAEVVELVPDMSEAEKSNYQIEPYTEDQYYNDWMRITQGLANPELAELVVMQSNATIHWLADQGLEFELHHLTSVRVGNSLRWAPGSNAVRVKGAGLGLSDSLFSLLERKQIEIRYETKAEKLLMDGQARVCGVRVKTTSGYEDIHAGGVIMACGGFESNRAMRTQYLGVLWEMAKVRGTRYNTGEGLKMALEIGAQPVGHWSGCHGTPIDADAPAFGDKEHAMDTVRYSYPFGVMVNMEGKRFIDEGEDIYSMTYAKYGEVILSQPQSTIFQLFDSKAKDLLQHEYTTGASIEWSSIPELAEKTGISAEVLAREIGGYNAAVQEGNFNPMKKDGKGTRGIQPPKTNWAQRLDSPPFFAYPVTGGITFTFGGVKVNREAQVIDTEEKIIPGLYATGEIVGDMFYHNYPGGAGLMRGTVLGRIAGANAAKG